MKTKKTMIALVATAMLASICAIALTACNGSPEGGKTLEYKTPTTAASVWEAKSISDLKAIDLSGKEVVYQISGTLVNAQGKGFGLMSNLYADGQVVTTQYTKGSPVTITYYGYWENTDDPAIDVTQFGCVITDAPSSMAQLNNTEYGADKNCNTYNSFTISDNAMSGSMNFSVAPMQYGATNSMTVKQEGTAIKYSDRAQFKAVVEALEETYKPEETGLTYKTPTTAASVWEAKSISDLKAIDLSGKEVVYQISGTSVNAQGKGFGLMVNLYADGLAVTTQYTKGTPITITYYGYWEKTDDPAIDVTQFGCVISDAPAGSAYERFNDTEYGADKNCNTYNSFTISNNALSGSMNFSVAPMQYGATNSMTVKQEGATIKYSDKAQFKAVVEALEETYTPTEE